ncbi:hypothetical protein ACQ4PT_019652 [Festuca glaucescens]
MARSSKSKSPGADGRRELRRGGHANRSVMVLVAVVSFGGADTRIDAHGANLREAQQQWLRPVEICEILKNYKNFHIAPEPPNMPASMTPIFC